MALQPVGVGDEVLSELREGRTRELLLLLQNRPIPEVIDPMNLQSGLSNNYQVDGENDYELGSDSTTAESNDYFDTTTDTTDAGFVFTPNNDLVKVYIPIGNSNNTLTDIKILEVSSGNTVATFADTDGGETIEADYKFTAGTDYAFEATVIGDVAFTDTSSSIRPALPYESTYIDMTDGWLNGERSEDPYYSNSVIGVKENYLSGYVADQFSAPTTSPTDFKQWYAVRAQEVTTGGSTSANPVEFEILDSTDTVLTTSNIPISEFADKKFQLRDRQYSEDAASDGQSDYTIPETGDGGHFGLPIWTVVTVKQNGSVLEPSNWEYDDVDTVTIDTSNVTISSGDAIEITYDFDVFDSTLQPRAYLNRESSSEDSPSISHFRYEFEV